MTPGEYLRKRREAAGVDLADLGSRGRTIGDQDNDVTIGALIDYQLAGVEFSLDVLFGIVAGIPVLVCRVCACSEFDPCDPDEYPCAWVGVAGGIEDLCTACVGKEPANAAAAA